MQKENYFNYLKLKQTNDFTYGHPTPKGGADLIPKKMNSSSE
jgi:hypothetical protein